MQKSVLASLSINNMPFDRIPNPEPVCVFRAVAEFDIFFKTIAGRDHVIRARMNVVPIQYGHFQSVDIVRCNSFWVGQYFGNSFRNCNLGMRKSRVSKYVQIDKIFSPRRYGGWDLVK